MVTLVGFHAIRPSQAHAASNASLNVTLLLVHGFGDTCDDAFNEVGPSGYAGTNPTTTVNFLEQNGWTSANIDEIGYYNPTSIFPNQRADQSWIYATDGPSNVTQTATEPPNNQNVSATGRCTSNLYAFDQANAEVANSCGTYTQGLTPGTQDEPIQSLGCKLAWYIYDTYTIYDRPVAILAHSMGGLIVRDALGGSGNTSGFPPAALYVQDVVTVATPHGGLRGGYLSNAQTVTNPATNKTWQEVNDMAVGSSFMTLMGTAPYQAPRGKANAHWALMGADVPCAWGGNGTNQLECTTEANIGPWPSGDGIVQGESAMAMNADYKVLYGEAEYFSTPQSTATPFVADLTTEYSHETNSCQVILKVLHLIDCLAPPFYLNDGTPSGQTINAWVCASNCTANIADMYANATTTAQHSLAEIVAQLGPTTIALSTAPLILRSNANGNFVSAELGYTGTSYAMLRARATSQGPWEMWTEVFLPYGNIALRSDANGDYVSTEMGYTGSNQYELRARAATIGPWEIYQIVWLSNSTYALKSMASKNYVSAELGYTGGSYAELRARSASIGSWETFTQGCTNYGALTTGPNACSGFALAGNAYPGTNHGWYSGGGVGLDGQEVWTYGNGTVQDSTATYTYSGLSTTLAYQVEAYIPNMHSDATHAHYHIHTLGGGDRDAYINQENFTNQWDTSDLGLLCTSDGNAQVTLADNGGDNYPLEIGADAIKLVATSLKCTY